MQATPQTNLVSPVTVAEFAEFIGSDAGDPILPGLLDAATDAVIHYLNLDLLQRDWVGIVPAPTSARLQLSPYLDPPSTFELPYTGLMSVNGVIGNEDKPLEFSVQAQRRPAKVTVNGWDYLSEIRIEYTAGMESVPAAIKSAIMMLGSFLFDHRGTCDATDGIKKSGAAMLLRPYKSEVSL